jgi:predicted acylesterase/phospholipase RssA
MDIIPLYKGKIKNIVVLSGGGMNGFATLGALQKLIELNIIVSPDIYCGTSIGAVIALLMSIGYTPINILNLACVVDISKLIISKLDNILEEVCFGLNSLEPVVDLLKLFMTKKNIDPEITFAELFKITSIKLIVTGTCINDTNLYYFSVDHSPDMKVIDAVIISISLPLFFKPFFYNNKYWIDGGCINNYPIDLFEDRLDDVIGINLIVNNHNESFEDIQTYIGAVVKSILKGQHYYKNNIFDKYSINIECPSNTCTNWDITDDGKKELYDLGYKSL